ncbi:MAG: M48 family metalloprotease [Deltaproteobacteria bacterium]|nr:M48 family metalloprotease [Deltaproteobacteria bacterium]MBW2322824.1 M48 family metalloprotease [Deltaproteobacteria bacterium]
MPLRFNKHAPVYALFILIFLILVSIPRPAFSLTYEEERELGRQFFNYIKKNMRLINDPDIVNYIDGLGQKILEGIGPQPFEYRFFIVDQEVINAFAAPAGYVFINSGLIMAFESEGQLAAILSHEIAHVTSRHLAERLQRSKKLSLVTLGAVMAGIFIGGQVGTALIFGSTAASMQAQLKYTREDEREADNSGLEYLVKAGYDPFFMLNSFQTLLQTQWQGPSDIPTYLTTHPSLDERMSSVEVLVATHSEYGKVKGRGDDQSFEAIKAKIVARYGDPVYAKNYFKDLLKKDHTAGLAHYGLAQLYQKQQNYDSAISEFKLALEKEPANTEVLTDFGALLFQRGNYPEASNTLGRAIILKPDSPRTLFYLARTYQEQGHLKQSKKLFVKLLAKNPDHVQGLYNLGLVYSRLNELARAHLNTGLYFKVTDKPSKALYHLKKAQKHASAKSPEVKKRIEQAIKEIKEKEKKRREKNPVNPGETGRRRFEVNRPR